MDTAAWLHRYRVTPVPSRFPERTLDVLTHLWYLMLLMTSEARTSVRLSPRHRWRAWRAGFSSQSYEVYGLATRPHTDYLSDWAQTRVFRVNGPFNALFRNKLVFARLLEHFGVPHAPAGELLHRGLVHCLDGGGSSRDLDSWLRTRGTGERAVVLKPAFGGGGGGIIFLRATEVGFTINGVAASGAEVGRLLQPLEHYLVTTLVEQGEYARRIYPPTINTVRLLTLWDDDTGRPFVAAAAHRFGNARSFPVDNFHAGRGGLSAP